VSRCRECRDARCRECRDVEGVEERSRWRGRDEKDRDDIKTGGGVEEDGEKYKQAAKKQPQKSDCTTTDRAPRSRCTQTSSPPCYPLSPMRRSARSDETKTKTSQITRGVHSERATMTPQAHTSSKTNTAHSWCSAGTSTRSTTCCTPSGWNRTTRFFSFFGFVSGF
jgi:hypothetical protein